MRFRIRHANIDPDLRKTFERYGVIVMQVIMGTSGRFWHKGGLASPDMHQNSLLPWLTEQHDMAERRETWLMVMEIAIVILVGAELIFSVMNFLSRSRG